MNNLPLQPLVWKGAAMANITHFEAQGAGIFYRINKIDGNHVVVWHDQSEGSSGSKELKNLEEAKNWAEFTHYPSKMQPYVKPTPTWIDVNERLPEEDGLYLAHYPDQPYEQQIVWFSSNINKFNLFHDLVTHWQSLPNPPEGE